MLFSDLTNPEYLEFTKQNPEVTALALTFGKQLEEDCPDWLLPEEQRGNLEVYRNVGAVIARRVLSVNLVKLIYAEQVEKGITMVQSPFGVWVYSNFLTKKPTNQGVEARLGDVYTRAMNSPANFLINRYDFKDGINGTQFPHLDVGPKFPSVALANGPGATRVLSPNCPIVPKRSREGALLMAKYKVQGWAVDLNTGKYDISIFYGNKFIHHGVRNSVYPETGESRLSLILNSVPA